DAPLRVGHRRRRELRGADARVAEARAARVAEDDHGRAGAHDVAVAQALPRRHALAVDVGPVAREALVGDRPDAADALELGVGARDVAVPVDLDVGAVAAADGHAVVLGLERDDALRAL